MLVLDQLLPWFHSFQVANRHAHHSTMKTSHPSALGTYKTVRTPAREKESVCVGGCEGERGSEGASERDRDRKGRGGGIWSILVMASDESPESTF